MNAAASPRPLPFLIQVAGATLAAFLFAAAVRLATSEPISPSQRVQQPLHRGEASQLLNEKSGGWIGESWKIVFIYRVGCALSPSEFAAWERTARVGGFRPFAIALGRDSADLRQRLPRTFMLPISAVDSTQLAMLHAEIPPTIYVIDRDGRIEFGANGPTATVALLEWVRRRTDNRAVTFRHGTVGGS